MGILDRVRQVVAAVLGGPHDEATDEATDRPAENAQPAGGPEAGVRYRTVTVQRGDTLAALAARHGADAEQIASLNGITAPELIYPGQVFKLPRG